MQLPLPFLSIGPAIRKRGDTLVVSTSWFLRFLTAFLWVRRVEVEPSLKSLEITDRYLWLFSRSREIPFSGIRAVTYGYVDETMASDFSARDTWDHFTVGVRLQNDDEIYLFSFVGEGTFQNDGYFPDWMHWGEHLLDFSGTQERTSRMLVNVLTRLMNVTVIPPRT